MKNLNVIVFYGGDNATSARDELLTWLKNIDVHIQLGLGINARKVSDWPANSGSTVDKRVEEAIEWADKAVLLLTPDPRGESGAPNVLEEFGRWRGKKGGESMIVLRHKDVKPHSNARGLIYVKFHENIIAECSSQIIQFLQDPIIIEDSSHSPESDYRRLPITPNLLIGRDSDLLAIKNRLGITNDPSLKKLTIIRGWPGVGKTTLINSLVHDEEVIEYFTDGVLWASLGEHGDAYIQLVAWMRQLDVYGPDVKSLDQAINRLKNVLRHKHILLIVDDVWEPDVGIPFKQILGANCYLVTTTRFPSVASHLASVPDDIYRLDVLSDKHGFDLLCLIAPTVTAHYPEECQTLVRDIEGLPLAILVAGRLLEEEYPLSESSALLLMQEIRDKQKLLDQTAPGNRFDPETGTTPTIQFLLKKSSDKLDEKARDCFSYLGVFAPKPATFDLSAMTYMWQFSDDKETLNYVRKLRDRGLIEPLQRGRFQMHALLVMHAQTLLA